MAKFMMAKSTATIHCNNYKVHHHKQNMDLSQIIHNWSIFIKNMCNFSFLVSWHLLICTAFFFLLWLLFVTLCVLLSVHTRIWICWHKHNKCSQWHPTHQPPNPPPPLDQNQNQEWGCCRCSTLVLCINPNPDHPIIMLYQAGSAQHRQHLINSSMADATQQSLESSSFWQ